MAVVVKFRMNANVVRCIRNCPDGNHQMGTGMPELFNVRPARSACWASTSNRKTSTLANRSLRRVNPTPDYST
ncbi:hypothetical protein KCP78_21030 [Salmonella enterica subsp. enterica]|nr:hypothetical protein KCP78_21030 [Salmonella enterica subsp. enterica]